MFLFYKVDALVLKLMVTYCPWCFGNEIRSYSAAVKRIGDPYEGRKIYLHRSIFTWQPVSESLWSGPVQSKAST